MECIYCFLMNSYQNKLKHDILEKKENDFTKLINEYKESFIKDLSKLTDVESCELKHDFPFEATDYLNNICELLRSKEKIEIISDAFGKIIDIYNTAIFESEVSAYNKLSNFIYNNCDLMVAPQKYLSKPLFRSRKDGDYPKKEENQYFHKPFSMRNEIGAQRFSLSGIPMLYCSENIRTTLKELNEDRLNSVNTALFFWSPKEYRAIKVFDLTNRLFANIEMEIFEINELNNNCSFDNTSFVKKSNIDKLISSFIFCQILQFPTSGSDKDKYIQEYKLPQMVMEFIKAQNKPELFTKHQNAVNNS